MSRRVHKVRGRRDLAAGGTLYRRESVARRASRRVATWVVVAVCGVLLVVVSVVIGLAVVLFAR